MMFETSQKTKKKAKNSRKGRGFRCGVMSPKKGHRAIGDKG